MSGNGRPTASDRSKANTSHQPVLAEIILLPLEKEVDDFETLSAVKDVTIQVSNEIFSIQGYSSQMVSDERHSAGVILLFGKIVHQVIVQKDLPIALLQAGTATLGALGKQRHVSKIEMTLDGDSLHIENPEKPPCKPCLLFFR